MVCLEVILILSIICFNKLQIFAYLALRIGCNNFHVNVNEFVMVVDMSLGNCGL